jgi:uridine kinase
MLGDKIEIKPAYLSLAKAILGVCELRGDAFGQGGRYIFGVGGESGSGKSVTAVCLQQLLATDYGKQAVVLHQDDYFVLPPLSNHNARKADLGWVGPQEVRLDLLESHAQQFLEGGSYIKAPLVDYPNNQILEQVIPAADAEVLIIEGTYILSIKKIMCKIFIDRDYNDTREKRLRRNRDVADPMIERVLEIEHAIIRQYLEAADIVVDKNYNISSVK